MEIQFKDSFKKEYSDKFGIRPSHARDAILNKDHVEFIRLDNEQQIVFFSKKVTLPRRELYLVVCTRQVKENLQVDFAFKVLPDLCSDRDQITPLYLLEKLAERFGLDISIGEVTAKFILRKQIPCSIEDPTRVVSVHNPDNHDYLQNMYFKITRGRIPYVDCAICFCIDTDLYRKWIGVESVEEAISKKEPSMIEVVYSPEAVELLKKFGISREHVHQTVNDRHRGILISGNPLRIGAIHWFDNQIIFVMGAVTKSHKKGNILKFDELTASLVLKLKDALPAGNINREMDFNNILGVVAGGFGVPVTCLRNGQPKMLHIESDWDSEIRFDAPEGHNIFLQGTFSPDRKKCGYVWAFSLEKYTTWFNSMFS